MFNKNCVHEIWYLESDNSENQFTSSNKHLYYLSLFLHLSKLELDIE